MYSCQFPTLSRLIARIGRFGRTCLDTVERFWSTRSAETSRSDRSGGEDDYSVQETRVTVSLDPDVGPTNRDELIEYGLSTEEYVNAVLERHNGRLKQRRFVDEYGWSSATVSRLLSNLEEQGTIERYRLGREKVVCLPDTAPRT
jgi:hypothetical protein